MLVVELDGYIHADKTVQLEDRNKEESLISYNLQVIRFTNDEVIKNIEQVLTSIKNVIAQIEKKGPLKGI